MGFLEKVTRGKKRRPRRVVIYGPHGIGKSTWAAGAPNPVFIQTEDGCGDLDVASFPPCHSATDAYGSIMELGGDVQHEFETLVIDSIDWLERLIWDEIILEKGVKAITDIDFGKGYGLASAKIKKILHAIDGVRAKGMGVILIAHCQVTKFQEPGKDTYDRYTPKLHKDASALVQEWADEVLFANYETFTRSSDEGFGNTRNIALGSGERVIWTQERPAHLAKNRLGLPEKIPMVWGEYAKHFSGESGNNVAGLVVDGSSKKKEKVS